jgi:hypothetical protein
MSEIITELPLDNIPLGTAEKDVFTWLYPPANKIETPEIAHSTIKINHNLILLLVTSSILIFSVIYPKFDTFWKKFLPYHEKEIFFSLSKVFFVYVTLTVLFYVTGCKNLI